MTAPAGLLAGLRFRELCVAGDGEEWCYVLVPPSDVFGRRWDGVGNKWREVLHLEGLWNSFSLRELGAEDQLFVVEQSPRIEVVRFHRWGWGRRGS